MNALDRRRLIICIVLALGTLAAFSPVLTCKFVNYDDVSYIGKPLVVRGISASGVVWAFTGIHSSNWHPITTLSHMVDCTLFGQNPLGHHAVNLLIHIANVVLLFLVFERMTKSAWKSAFVAALFAIHPLHVESVAWIAERKDTLSTLFMILTIGAYVRYVESESDAEFRWVVILYALGLMSKPMLVTLPILLLLLDYWPLGRLHLHKGHKRREGWSAWPLIREKAVLFAMAAASCAITYCVQSRGGAEVALSQIPIITRVENALVSYATYVLRMFWPTKLAPFYPYPIHGVPVWQPLVSLVFLAGVMALALRTVRTRGYLIVGWLWYLIALIPVIGIVQVGEQAMADRYAYVPLIGLFIMITWLLQDVPHKQSASGRLGDRESERLLDSRAPIHPFAHSLILPVVCALILVVLAAMTWVQTGYWKDRLTLFTHALKVTNDNYLAHDMVGAALNRQGKYEQAVEHFQKALEIKPRDPFVLMNLGNSLTRMNRLREAIETYDQATAVKPGYPLTHFNRAIALVMLGRDEEAVEEFRTVIKLNRGPRGHPEMFTTDISRNLAKVDQLAKMVASRPNDAHIRRRYALALADAGRLDEAIDQLARPALGGTTATAPMGSPRERAAYYQLEIASDAKNAKAHYGLANALCDMKMRIQGIREYREAIRLKPDFLEAHNNLAVALYFVGDYAEAWSEVHECRKLGAEPRPGFLKALAAKMPDPGR